MSDSPLRLPARPSFEQLQKQAKALLKAFYAGDTAAREQLGPGEPKLADAQFAIARDYGFESWAALKHRVDELNPAGVEVYEKLAQELADGYMRGDAMAIREMNWSYGTDFVCDFHDSEKMQHWLPIWFASETRAIELAQADARQLVARSYGFDNWDELAGLVKQPISNPRSTPVYQSSAPPFYKIDWAELCLSVRGPQTAAAWDVITAVMREQGLSKLDAGGITDEGLERISRLSQVTHLTLPDSTTLSAKGTRHLADMPQLVHLELGGWKSTIDDEALAPLQFLTFLRHFKSTWTQGISDAGLVHLRHCPDLEEVNVMGTHAGDGLIRALAGKAKLAKLSTGREVTDGGLLALHDFPVFTTPRLHDVEGALVGWEEEPNALMLDGPFTDAGLASLKGLDGLYKLAFFWHSPLYTSSGLAALGNLANLEALGCEGKHCDDEAMGHISALPRLRRLMAQGAVASDAGFEALSRSSSLRFVWGRECPNFTGRGFVALGRMPSLRGMAISCKNVDHSALAQLPTFPALTQFMPMDVPDEGFRHVGACENIERLWCMYCRDTGDVATEHIAGLTKLRTYYAGMTQITDRSLAVLGKMLSLEKLEFWACAGISDAGIAQLAGLPHLKEITLGGLPGVSKHAAALFPPRVRVSY